MCLGEAVDVRVESGFLKVVGSIPVVAVRKR